MPDQSVTTSNPPIPRQTPSAITLQPVATPTHGAGGSFSIISSLPIAASPDIVFVTLVDHTTWPDWNRFVRHVTIISAPPPSSAPSPDASALEAAIALDDGQRYIKQGTRMTFQVHLDPDNEKSHIKQSMEVTLLEPFDGKARDHEKHGWRVAWKATSIPSLLLRAERVLEFVDDGHGGTEYTCWETMYGPLAPVVRLTTGKSLEKGFEAWAVDLKAQAERRAKQGG